MQPIVQQDITRGSGSGIAPASIWGLRGNGARGAASRRVTGAVERWSRAELQLMLAPTSAGRGSDVESADEAPGDADGAVLLLPGASGIAGRSAATPEAETMATTVRTKVVPLAFADLVGSVVFTGSSIRRTLGTSYVIARHIMSPEALSPPYGRGLPGPRVQHVFTDRTRGTPRETPGFRVSGRAGR